VGSTISKSECVWHSIEWSECFFAIAVCRQATDSLGGKSSQCTMKEVQKWVITYVKNNVNYVENLLEKMIILFCCCFLYHVQ
jgi:hypothetical protein